MLKCSLSKFFYIDHISEISTRHLISIAHKNKLCGLERLFKQIYLSKGKRGIQLHSHRFGKSFHESENEFAHKVMETSGYKTLVYFPSDHLNQQTRANISNLGDGDWLSLTPTELCSHFCRMAVFYAHCNVPITDPLFDAFVNVLEVKIQYFSDVQLSATFNGLKLFPESDKVDSKNFFKIWSALDRACVSRLHKWSYDQILMYADYTYLLKIARMCEYTSKCVDLLSINSSNLSCQQMVQTYFYMGLLRRPLQYVSNLELKVKQCLHQLNLDELAVISLGLFKSKSRIQDFELLQSIIELIIKDSSHINEISLASIMKLIRYSFRSGNKTIIDRLFNTLDKEINRLSLMCCVQIALLSLSTQTYHMQCLDRISTRAMENMAEARLKDIERLILVFVSLGYQPYATDFFLTVIQELSNSRRKPEIYKYGKSYARCISYLTMCNLYPTHLINEVLDPKFIGRVYGSNVESIDRSLYVIDKAVEIGSRSYKGNRLTSELSNKLAYTLREKSSYESNYTSPTASFKVMTEVIEILRKMRGNNFVITTYVLPQYQKPDIIFSDNARGEPRKLNLEWFDNKFGSIVWTPDRVNRWYALSVLGRQAYIHNTNRILGHVLTKCEQLKAIGYIPILVSWRVWSKLNNDEQKSGYLQKLIRGPKKI